ncbi:hypothetical protein COEREDRAFT_93146 [Coemansia reversa NRRL 1564]|uniref:Uncharacterized protein n=1 Tax=Coemansia reversa (strain ATCC 12441 / NRRL 1564) TaxID=763665 RepID=A0A2G5B986_COERN|nr:hypothetical protein COEREDRAFT_93146 [Coemansia reversa NRRL 1564]|eukprot:PIA15542.1 hypothetical protein COEREDRAFT_93146 [Coemansia reversa NRRL 1564]
MLGEHVSLTSHNLCAGHLSNVSCFCVNAHKSRKTGVYKPGMYRGTKANYSPSFDSNIRIY